MTTEERPKFQRYDDGDYDPHDFREVDKPVNNGGTMIHILKGCVGTGILAMPQAFSLVGTMAGIAATIVVGIFCTYSIYLLVNSTYNICKLTKMPYLSYGDAMRAGLTIGPPKLRKFTKFGGILVDCFFIAYQVGICSVYIVFVTANIKDVLDDYTELNIYFYFAAFAIPFFLTMLLRNLKVMVPVSMVANVLTFASFGICLYYIFQDIPSLGERPAFKSILGYPLFLGVTLFAIQAIGVVIAIENNMKTPKSFVHGVSVFYITQTIIITLYIIIGFCGYWKYGDDTKASLTLNLPPGEIGAKVARVFYALSIFGSYCLQLYPAVKTIWDDYLVRRISEEKRNRSEYGLRVGLFLLTYILAMSVPMLGLIISLVGCLCVSALAFVFPPIMDCLAKYPDKYGCCKWIIIKNIIVILIGFSCLSIGTYFTIFEIVQKLME